MLRTLLSLSNYQIAEQFLDFLSEKEIAAEYAATVGAIPAFRDVPPNNALKEDYPILKSLLDSGNTYPIRSDWSEQEFHLSRKIAEAIQYVSGVYGDSVAPVWEENSELNPIISAILKEGW